jgi:hypothetical protein
MKTTIDTAFTGGAVNDLLLRGMVELSRGNDAGALECFGGLLEGSGESTVAALEELVDVQEP